MAYNEEANIGHTIRAILEQQGPSIHIEEIIVERQQDDNQTAPWTLFSSTLDLCVVVPTRNERDNIRPLLESLQDALDGLCVEVIFVDDSDDDTPEVIMDAKRAMNSSLLHIQLEHRLAGEERVGGLATAVMYGINRAQAGYVVVIGADLQHPPQLLRVLYDQAVAQDADLVVASRYMKGGSSWGLADGGRRFISVGMKWTAKLLFPGQLLRISDPLSGFFLLRRSLLTDVVLRPIGYKILLEILIRCQWRRVIEVPYRFQTRAQGQSKANMQQGMLALLHMQRLWREVPAAGRIWKVGLLLLLNVLVTLALIFANKAFPGILTNFSVPAFVVVACLDLVLFNRLILPSAKVTDGDEVSSSALQTLEDAEQVEFPTSQSTSTNGYRLCSIEDRERVELPSKKSIASSAFKFARKFQPRWKKKIFDRLPVAIAAVVVTLAVGWIIYVQPGASLILAILSVGLAITFAENIDRDQAITMILAVAVGAASIDYVSWRIVATNWHDWWISLPLLWAEVFGVLHVLGFQFTVWPRRPPQIGQGDDPTRHPIFVFIPTVNEGTTILRATLKGILVARDKYLARYPHAQVTIILCNDGRVAKAANWEETDRLAEELSVCCVTRTIGGGAKAGNIENASRELHVPDNALLVIFDADQIAKAAGHPILSQTTGPLGARYAGCLPCPLA